MKSVRIFAFTLLALLALSLSPAFGQETTQELRKQAQAHRQKGNWKDAYTLFSRLVLDPQDDPVQAGDDLRNAVECLQRLDRVNEFDALVEKAVTVQRGNWRVLHAAAGLYLDAHHYGFIVSGKFERGSHRGGGDYAHSNERDRARAIQLGLQAIETAKEANADERALLYHRLAEYLMRTREDGMAWRLQYLTDLDTLPDYEEGYGGYGWSSGAPVDAAGNPVYYRVPETWADAANDGERWRWALSRAAANNPGFEAQAQYEFAEFLYNQFDVRTMRQYRWFRTADDDDAAKPGPYAVSSLSDNETIARLATGVRRFTLPDEFNYIKIYQQIAKGQDYHRNRANTMLGTIFADRRQFERAAEYYKLAEHNDQVKQIRGNWGQFGPVMTQPAGKGATVEYRFRNGKKVSLNARAINVQKLLADVQAHIKAQPKHVEWDQVNISDIGYRLITKNQTKYLGKTVASWSETLEPRADHYDRLVTLQTPLKQAGAYLLTAKMESGNTCYIVLWLADLTIVKKPLGEKIMYYVADAVTGKPVAGARVNLFGYRHEWVEKQKDHPGEGYYRYPTKTSSGVTDANGMLIMPADTKESYNWLITAKTGARLAYLGFTSAWRNTRYDAQYNEEKAFIITDRPVYRPGQTVKFKVWVAPAKYDQEGKNPFAGQDYVLVITSPRDEPIFDKTFTADNYGGFDGEFTLEDEATLGDYNVFTKYGGASFRVEEYKKPEFEVTVDAPAEPVMLGEKITATIIAKYYFGAPVTEAKVKYKVLRTSTSGNWYPAGAWDWFYGPGYWWFAYDYPWYPRWREWGCPRPVFSWWGRYGHEQPEVVAEAEAAIGKDGTLQVPIDTALAKEMQGNTDHRYEITVEVTDQSRRTIVGAGQVLVARKPFKVYAWTNRGYYRAGDVVHAYFNAQTLDHKSVQGKGMLRLLKISYVKQNAEWVPAEKEVQRWELDPNDRGRAYTQLTAAQAGQYRLSYTVTDKQGHEIEGGYLFTVRGTGFTGNGYKFTDIELIPDQREYRPGDKVRLMINTNRADATVLLFLRPTNGVYLPPQVIRLAGKSTVVEIPVEKKDMPNFFVEAVTIADGQVYTEAREIVVPPEKRVLNVDVLPAKTEYKPGEQGTVKLRLTGSNGEPFRGSAVVSIYDKSVEYISGGGNVPDIREFFWKWRRSHYPRTESSLQRGSGNLVKSYDQAMQYLGVFGYSIIDGEPEYAMSGNLIAPGRVQATHAEPSPMPASAPVALAADSVSVSYQLKSLGYINGGGAGDARRGAGQPLVQPTVRQNFADTALWVAKVETNAQGEAEVTLTMPENLTAWKARVWAMGEGTQVGEGSAELTTTKDLIVRLQAPRFFTQNDEVVISANVHNYLKTQKDVQVSLELEGDTLISLITYAVIPPTDPGPGNGPPEKETPFLGETVVEEAEIPVRKVTIPAGGETRMNWRVRVKQPGTAVIRVKALTDEESDAMQMSFPVYVHGMLRTESFSGVIRPDKQTGEVKFRVPAERRPEQTRLEVRYSPTLAGAMVDALPYLVDYPYGCTEQTLNRFLPTVITQNTLKRMGLNLKQIQEKRTNLNAQEIGDDLKRAADWKRMYLPGDHNPVFDEKEVAKMVKYGQARLRSMQCQDGGWGWFSGSGEQSWPHTTALVVHGLQVARANDALADHNMLDRGIEWLERYQQEQVKELKLWETSGGKDGKQHADALDAFVYMVLADEKRKDAQMRDYLYRDRTELPVYAKAMYGLALHRLNETGKRDMLLRNIEQYLVEDDENQTAYLKVGESWWWWYGSEIEADAYYLKLLAAVDPKGERASRLVKYLVNNRKHATYWNSTRDTAIVIEALADYLRASGEESPNLTLQLLLDGKAVKAVTINKENLFSFDNKLILEGAALAAGEHTLTLQKQGAGPLYFNAYLTNFTLEDHITKAGLEIKVDRTFYRLVPKDKTVKTAGSRGQALDMKVEKYDRELLKDLSTVKSGDLVEVELTVDSKNDYEYIIFEDMKAAGCEPVDVQSGYHYDGLRSYIELRDERVCFFVRRLPRGTHSLSYRLRAEIPGRFSAMPTKASAMYAPELKANSDEMKLQIED
ncbi:MAG: alpha-2-macroglobulin family protein [Armatimonadota bacterium]